MIARYHDNVITKGQDLAVVQGTIRWNDSASAWEIIDDANHIRAKNVLNVTGNKTPVINYEHTFSRTGAFLCGIDESYAREYQIAIGPTVGLSSTSIQIFHPARPVQMRCFYDGADWDIEVYNDTYFSPEASGLTISETSGTITVEHDDLYGIVQLQPLGAYRADSVGTSFDAGGCDIELRDFSNSLITSFTTSHQFILQRMRQDTEITQAELDVPNSNIWFAGEFEL